MKKITKFSLDIVKPISPSQCAILQVLSKEDCSFTQKALSERTKIGISGLSKALEGLEHLGLTVSYRQDVKSYLLNPHRKKEIKRFLTGYDLGKKRPLILSGHAFVYEAQINDLPNKLCEKLNRDNSFISYHPKHWRMAYMKTLIDGSFSIRKTKNSCKIICYFRTFGLDPAIIEQINNEKFIELKNSLEGKYLGLKIGNFECIAVCPWQEYAIQKDHVAVEGIVLGIKHKKIEQSYGYPEWEEKGYNAREKITKIIRLREREVEELERPLNKDKQNNQQDKNRSNKEINEKEANNY